MELASEIGIPEVKVVYLTIFNEELAGESILNKQEMIRKYFNAAGEIASKKNINLKVPEIQGEGDAGNLKHKPCPFPWRDLYIGSDGFVRPCQSSADKLFDIREYSSPVEAWNSQEMQQMRATVNDEELMPRGCANCYHSSCANWNLPTSFVQLGTTFAPEWIPKEKC